MGASLLALAKSIYYCFLFVTPKFYISIVFSFSWELKWPQGNLKQCLYKILGWQTKSIMHDRTRRASTVSNAYESLVHCTSIPNIPSPKSRWLFFPQRPVKRLNPLLCQEWRQYIENKPENAGRKTWHNYFLFFFLKKTWIEENADWIWSAKTLLRVFVWVLPLKTLNCIQT